MKSRATRMPVVRKKTAETTARKRHKKTAVRDRTNLWWSVYEAADRSDFKGFFFLPNLTPSEQMNSLSERAVTERCDFLYKNVGAVQLVVNGLALDEVGSGLWPKWISSDEAYNRFMTDSFHYANVDPRIFSADGHSDFYSAQYNIRRMIRLYGDAFGQLLRPGDRPSSYGSAFPSMAIYPGYIVDNAGSETPEEGWQRGVHRDILGRPDKYRVLNKEHADGYQDVDADDLLHFHDPFFPGEIRGVPALASVVRKLFRREDIGKALANGTLARERLGYTLNKKDDSDLPRMPGVTESSVVKNSDGTKYTVQRIFGFDTEDQVAIPELPTGAEIKMLESNRPGTQVMDYLDSILIEVAYTTLYPPNYVFYLAGRRQGTEVRLMLQKVKGVINSKRNFQLIPQLLNRFPRFYAWKTRAAYKGTIPDDWWKTKIIPPFDYTVDLGREGRLYDERMDSWKMPIDEYYGLGGWDRADVDRANFAALQERVDALNAFNKKNGTNFTYFDQWPRSASFARATGAPDPGTAEELGGKNVAGGANGNGRNGNGAGSPPSRNRVSQAD
ncbi:MAG TPA: phage portal protein [Chthoniobacterales bacterium]